MPWRTTCLAIATLILTAGAFIGLTGCAPEKVAEEFAPTNDHAQYVAALRQLNLDGRPLGALWIAAGEDALENGEISALPHSSLGSFDPAIPEALAYTFDAGRGRRIDITFEAHDDEGAVLRLFPAFVDTFRLTPDENSDSVHIASLPIDAPGISFEPRRNGRYLVRIQPELLVGGAYAVTITEGPVLAFPVEGKDESAVASVFGDPRDGGSRDHHGIDIFAPRGTNVLAPVPGSIRRVGDQRLGGKVVILWDPERSLNLYFAHLDSQAVKRGEQVKPGDVLGTVGNTGNARTTSPHLHFGIYTRYWDPIDPYPYVAQEWQG